MGRRLLIALAVAASVAGACGGEPAEIGSSPSEPRSSASDPAGPTAGTEAATGAPATEDAGILTFEATTVDGGTFDGSSLAGRDVAIWFWAPW